MRKAFRFLFLMLNIAAVIALLVSYLSVFIPPDKYWVPALFGLAFPFLVAANLIFVIFWLLVKPKYSLISVLAVLVGWSMLSRYVQFGGSKTENEGIKVLSYNVQHFTGNDELKEKEVANRKVAEHKIKAALRKERVLGELKTICLSLVSDEF